jgi:uncharacterized membrane protein YcaP (DUF421 family)
MDSIISALGIYIFLLAIFRLTGNRSLAQITTFDAVLILIIAEAVQSAMVDIDESMTNAMLLVITLLGFDVFLSIVSVRSSILDKLINDIPTLLVDDGEFLQDRMTNVRVSQNDIMEQARSRFGIERCEQIKYAVLERNGSITVVPKQVGWTLAPDAMKRASDQEADRGPAVDS